MRPAQQGELVRYEEPDSEPRERRSQSRAGKPEFWQDQREESTTTRDNTPTGSCQRGARRSTLDKGTVNRCAKDVSRVDSKLLTGAGRTPSLIDHLDILRPIKQHRRGVIQPKQQGHEGADDAEGPVMPTDHPDDENLPPGLPDQGRH